MRLQSPIEPRLRIRLFALWLALWGMLLLAGGLVGWNLYVDHAALDAQERERLVNQSDVIDRNLGRQLLATSAALDAMRSELPWLRRQHDSAALINRHLQTMRKATPGMRALTLFDADGTLTARSPEQFIGQNFSTREYFQIARNGADPDRLYVSSPFMTETGEMSINVVKVVTDQHGGFAGILSASLGPDYFSTLLGSVLYAKDMRVALVHGGGKIAFLVPDPQGRIGADLRSSPASFFARHVQSGVSTSVFDDVSAITGEASLAVARTLGTSVLDADRPLVTIISRGKAAVFAQWRKSAWTHAILFSALALGALLGLFQLQRHQRDLARVQADQEIRRRQLELTQGSEAFKQSILNSVAAEIAVLDGDGTIVMVNDSWNNFARENSVRPGEPVPGTQVGANYLAVCQSDDGVAPQAAHEACDGIRAVLSGHQAHFEMEYPCHSPTRQRWFSMSVTRLESATQAGVVIVHTDISARMQAESALLIAHNEANRANRAKSNFLSNMSHELRTPLNSILGFAQLMDYDTTLPAAHQDNVQEILGAGKNLLQLINEILDLAKVESEQVALTMEPVDVDTVVQECLHQLAAVADAHRIALGYAGLSDAAVWADRTRLRQVLLNLLSNAIKYNRLGGSVQVQVQPEEPADSDGTSSLRIVVSDTGAGIPGARLGELFQPFSRLGAESGVIEGTGIGLNIARRLAELMGGSVGVESEVGVGSRFWIELPCAPADSSAQVLDGQTQDAAMDERTVPIPEQTRNGSAAVAQPLAPAQRSVLYIEDNLVNLRLVAQILRRRAYLDVLTAATPALGIATALAHRPDLILLDINMPGMDGFEVLQALRAAPALVGIPVVAVSANAMESDIARAMAAGFSGYVTKPLNVDHFNTVVDHWLGLGARARTVS